MGKICVKYQDSMNTETTYPKPHFLKKCGINHRDVNSDVIGAAEVFYNVSRKLK